MQCSERRASAASLTFIDRQMRRNRHAYNVWELAILRSIRSLGGEAGLQDIYDELRKFIELSDDDLAPQDSALGRPAYQQQVRSHIANLCQAGQLECVARGHYALTRDARQKLDLIDSLRAIRDRI
jgi:hypothetical protein